MCMYACKLANANLLQEVHLLLFGKIYPLAAAAAAAARLVPGFTRPLAKCLLMCPLSPPGNSGRGSCGWLLSLTMPQNNAVLEMLREIKMVAPTPSCFLKAGVEAAVCPDNSQRLLCADAGPSSSSIRSKIILPGWMLLLRSGSLLKRDVQEDTTSDPELWGCEVVGLPPYDKDVPHILKSSLAFFSFFQCVLG